MHVCLDVQHFIIRLSENSHLHPDLLYPNITIIVISLCVRDFSVTPSTWSSVYPNMLTSVWSSSIHTSLLSKSMCFYCDAQHLILWLPEKSHLHIAVLHPYVVTISICVSACVCLSDLSMFAMITSPWSSASQKTLSFAWSSTTHDTSQISHPVLCPYREIHILIFFLPDSYHLCLVVLYPYGTTLSSCTRILTATYSS